MVYGNAIVNAQKDLLQHIKPNSSLLIAGGGTGWILETLTEIYSEGIEIEYIEMSKKMIALSKKRNTGKNKISFIQQSIEEYFPEKKFDYILTAFFFDNFKEEKIKTIFSKLDSVLKPCGYWLYADFTNNNKKQKLWQKIFLKTMYTFFRITCKIETTTLINMQPFFQEYGYAAHFSSTHYAGFIRSEAYKKP
jgi:ubiquinone/menaquinone biosynthesis C-methylase UbiE